MWKQRSCYTRREGAQGKVRTSSKDSDWLSVLCKVCVSPYKQSEDIINYFLQLPVSEIRYGKQKKQTYEAFKQEIDELSLYRRNSSMQVNSGIREFHDELLKSEYNTGNYKSVVGIYNTFIREMEQ